MFGLPSRSSILPYSPPKSDVNLIDPTEDYWYQEKVDGWQVSFARIGDKLYVRNRKGPVKAGSKGWKPLFDSLYQRKDRMVDEMVYHCEYLSSAQQNIREYMYKPHGCLVLFDIDLYGERLYHQSAVHSEARNIDIEHAFIDHRGPYSKEKVDELLDDPSFLGGPREGLVLKPVGPGDSVKFVRPAHTREQKDAFLGNKEK